MAKMRMDSLIKPCFRLSMKWNNGHLWTIQIAKSELESNFEFKFVIKEGNHLARWEEGMNHHYDIEKYLSRLKQPEILQ